MDKKQVVLFNEEQIKSTVERLGKEISETYDEPIVVISLLRGSFVFAADLVRQIINPTIVEFMTTSSYGDDMETTGKVQILHDVRENIEGMHVIVVDDICDSGYTLKAIVEHLKGLNPKSIKTCVFLDKPSRRMTDLYPDFVGQTIDDLFVVGYGLNFGSYYRNCPYIFAFVDKDENEK